MSQTIDPQSPAAEAAPTTAERAVLWQHVAFCRAALPLRAPRGAWLRRVADALIRIEPASAAHALPGGVLLRLALLHISDAAVRADGPVVEVGASADVMAARLGEDTKPRDLADMVERMLAAKLSVSIDGGAELAVLDARGRPRAVGSAWRPTVRLSTAFFASLVANAVPLDRQVVEKVAPVPMALDAYGWIRHVLHNQPAEHTVTAPWDDLLARFGSPSQDIAAFRPAFEEALRAVFDADLSTALAVDDEGVTVCLAVPGIGDDPVADQQELHEADGAAVVPTSATVEPEPAPSRQATHADEVQRPPAGFSGVAERMEPARPIMSETVSLRQHATGLNQVIWLRRGDGQDHPLVGVTPGGHYDPDRATLLAVEPMVVQVSGGLNPRDFERVTAWIMINRDLIDGFWEGQITTQDEIDAKLRKVPAPGFR
jgi:hypothetical protein